MTTQQESEGAVGAVLPGKPNPFDYGAVPKGSGYWWPAPDKYGRILVPYNNPKGKRLLLTVQKARYKAALQDWQRRNAAYQQRVAASGPDPAMRAALRAAQAQIAAQSNRIAALEQQIAYIGQQIASGTDPQSISFTPDDYSDQDAYYYDPDQQAPGGYFDDEGGYGAFDGMSGADGDLGFVRRYGRGRMGYGRGYARAPSAYYASAYPSPDAMYGDYIDDMMGPASDAPHPDPAAAMSNGTSGSDDMGGMEMVDDGVGAVHLPPHPHGPVHLPPRHHGPIHLPPRPHASHDRRDVAIRNLTRQVRQGHVDVNALLHDLHDAGCILDHETRRKELDLAVRHGDGVSGASSGPTVNGDLSGAPTPPAPEPPPTIDDVGGADCGCGAPPGDG